MIAAFRKPTQIKSTFWLAYFMASIGFLGLFSAFLLGSPLYLLGRVFPPATSVADRILRRAIWTLMKVQPWFDGNVEIPANPGPVLIVSNHRSHLDAFILLSRVAGIRILAKDSLFRVPFLGIMMRLMHQIPVKSGQMESYFEAMEVVKARLSRGETVHVFPELTRCPPGFRGTLKFSVLPFQAAIQQNAKILPVVFKGTDLAWSKGTLGISWRAPIVARALEPVDPAAFSSALELKNAVQHRIDQALS
ncbi:MAG TPA: lysophospholipid acyltransferase family protein [Bdellovibrionales bacterium]|nr:lysophospholipid acyltransferase family protein [Bdellovibrionales bacterium]